MDTIQAAILLEILEIFPDEVMKRLEIGASYTSNISNLSGIVTPKVGVNNTSVFAQYTIISENRQHIQSKLKENNIPSVSYYSVPLHLQPVFKNLGHKKGDFPVSEKVATQCLSLPMSPYLKQIEQNLVIQSVLSQIKNRR